MTIHSPAPKAASADVCGVVNGETGLMWWVKSCGTPRTTSRTNGISAMTAKSTEESPTHLAPTMLRAVSGMMKQLTARIQCRSMFTGPIRATTVAPCATGCQS